VTGGGVKTLHILNPNGRPEGRRNHFRLYHASFLIQYVHHTLEKKFAFSEISSSSEI
jgi:hypothetical protein